VVIIGTPGHAGAAVGNAPIWDMIANRSQYCVISTITSVSAHRANGTVVQSRTYTRDPTPSSYVDNRPTVYVDPSGMQKDCGSNASFGLAGASAGALIGGIRVIRPPGPTLWPPKTRREECFRCG
jgi:hypothetical protein